jgi:hypothetical protein
VGTEDVLSGRFLSFRRSGTPAAYAIREPGRFAIQPLRDSRTKHCYCQFVRAHRDLRASLSLSGTRGKGTDQISIITVKRRSVNSHRKEWFGAFLTEQKRSSILSEFDD